MAQVPFIVKQSGEVWVSNDFYDYCSIPKDYSGIWIDHQPAPPPPCPPLPTPDLVWCFFDTPSIFNLIDYPQAIPPISDWKFSFDAIYGMKNMPIPSWASLAWCRQLCLTPLTTWASSHIFETGEHTINQPFVFGIFIGDAVLHLTSMNFGQFFFNVGRRHFGRAVIEANPRDIWVNDTLYVEWGSDDYLKKFFVD